MQGCRTDPGPQGRFTRVNATTLPQTALPATDLLDGLMSTLTDQPPILAHSHGDTSTPSPQRGQLRFATSGELPFPPPTGREEQWRFTPLQRLEGLATALPWQQGEIGQLSVQLEAAAPGARLEQVPCSDPRVGQLPGPVDYVAAQTWQASRTAHVLHISCDAVADQPIHLYLTGSGTEVVTGHLVLDVDAGTHATVVLHGQGQATVANNVEVRVGADSSLTLLSVLDWEPASVQVGSHSVRLQANARVRHGVVSLGGAVVRLHTSVDFAATGGDATMVGLYVAQADQHLEHRLFLDHSQPHCKSRVEYKGALQGQGARTVWVGDVLIRAAAEGTDTYELNRNLLLTPGAQADSVPNLEIETGEIAGAGHASATGRFDDEQLFYLMARGIDRAQARRLVVRGFFADVVAQFGVPQLAEQLMQQVEGKLHPALDSMEQAS